MYKHLNLLTTLLFLALSSLTRAQATDRDSVVMPYPEIGWEKLGELLIYPEIPKRAGLEGLYIFSFVIDSIGNPVLLEVRRTGSESNDEKLSLTKLFDGTFNEVKWVPAVKNGEKIYCKIDVPVLMYLPEEKRAPLIIKQTARPIITKDMIE